MDLVVLTLIKGYLTTLQNVIDSHHELLNSWCENQSQLRKKIKTQTFMTTKNTLLDSTP